LHRAGDCPQFSDGILTARRLASMTDYRVIPSIDQLLQRPGTSPLVARFGHDATVEALRAAADAMRTEMAGGASPPASSDLAASRLERDAANWLAATHRPSLARVLNATGVIIHTNLGRAPLAQSAVHAVARLVSGCTNLEYDLAKGGRGARDVHAEALLCRLTGAEAAVVVNNCAAATLLVLAALARGRDVLVSRGELVEIGGGFRVPDVMAQSGARLREVGTTNRTRANDYALAIGEKTGAILRVHPSNFTIEGFTERASLDDLVALGRRFNVPVIEDLGSGLVTERTADGEALPAALAIEPSVQSVVRAGADVVCFSGDKLLGGPQAGLIVGRQEYLARVRRHPLMRALRVDKMTYAALEATLAEHLSGKASDTVPVVRMATMPLEAIAVRAEIVAARARNAGFGVEVIEGHSTIGGGSAAGSRLPTKLIALTVAGVSADGLEVRLRQVDPPLIARILDDRVVIDLRTIDPKDDEELAGVLDSVDRRAEV
jgi:L-seryl-tRNA(Ser) seleniumtransferase